MKVVYQNKKGVKIYSKRKIPQKGEYVYFLSFPKLKKDKKKIVKIGTTNDIMRRMKEHLKYYDTDIVIEWISKDYRHFTTLRVEENMKELWKQNADWEYMKNDRFIIPEDEKEIVIKVRKEYMFYIE